MQTTQKEWRPGLVALYRDRHADLALRHENGKRQWIVTFGKFKQNMPLLTFKYVSLDLVWVGTREEFEALRTRAETPADLLRLAREAAAEQERDAVAELDAETETIWRSDFKELAYTTPGRTVLRFRGLDDVSLSDANARAMAAQILGGAEGVVPVADVEAALEGGAAEGPEPEVVAAVRQAANDSTTIHMMLDDVGIGSGPQVERVRQLADAWRLLSSTHNATIQEAVEGRAAAEAKLDAQRSELTLARREFDQVVEEKAELAKRLRIHYRSFRKICRALGRGFGDSSAETCAAEISRLVALADAVREIVGGPADAEALRAKFEEARTARYRAYDTSLSVARTLAEISPGWYLDASGDVWRSVKAGTVRCYRTADPDEMPDESTADFCPGVPEDPDPVVEWGPFRRIG